MLGVTKVLAFNGVEVGELVDASEDVVRFRTPQGHEVVISASAVFEHRGGVLRLICYDTGIHRWEVEALQGGGELGSPPDELPGSPPG